MNKSEWTGQEEWFATDTGSLQPGWGNLILVGLPNLGTKMRSFTLPFILKVIADTSHEQPSNFLKYFRVWQWKAVFLEATVTL